MTPSCRSTSSWPHEVGRAAEPRPAYAHDALTSCAERTSVASVAGKDPDEKLTLEEVCKELKISPSTFYDWRHSHRKNIARVLTATTLALLTLESGFRAGDITQALMRWGYNSARRDRCPPDAARILAWLETTPSRSRSWRTRAWLGRLC
jgi:hypothetical protein